MQAHCMHACKVFKEPLYVLVGIVSALLLFVLQATTSNYGLIAGNLGIQYYYLTLALQVVISLLFGVNVTLVLYRFVKLNRLSKRSSFLGTIGAFFALLISGCGACGLSLAALLGFSAVITMFPLHGIELKLIAIILLAGSIYFAANPSLSCKRKKKH